MSVHASCSHFYLQSYHWSKGPTYTESDELPAAIYIGEWRHRYNELLIRRGFFFIYIHQLPHHVDTRVSR